MGVLVGGSMDDDVLEGLALTLSTFGATADVGFSDGFGDGR